MTNRSRERGMPVGTVNIRPAVPEDAAQLRELRLEALAHHPEAFSADLTAATAESVEMWGDRIAKNAERRQGVICVASHEDRLVGMTGVVRGHWPKTQHSGTIWGVYVNLEWRGNGIAEALLDACEAWAHEQGLSVLKLFVVTTNAPAIRCYARCGFTVYGIEPQALFYNGAYYDELLMSKPILP